MTTINPDGKTTYSALIKDALGADKPAPYHVTLSDGTILRNKWVVECHQGTPTMGERQPHYCYSVFNWANEIDTHKIESYSFYDHDYVSTFTKHSAKSDAEKKCSDLNIRDRCILALVNGGIPK